MRDAMLILASVSGDQKVCGLCICNTVYMM